MSRIVLRRVHARRRAARRRRARAAGDRAGHADAGRHGPDAPQLRRALARARAVGLRRRAACSSSTRASRPPRPSPRRADPRHGLPAGRRRRAVAALPGRRPALPQAAPAARGHRRHARSPRTPGCCWHPALAPLAQLHAEGKVSVLPAVGYDHPDQSHFTSRHFWEVGATDTRAAHRLDGPLPRRGGHGRQPAAGAVADRLAAAGARDGEGAGRGDRRPRPVRLLGRPACGARSRTRMLDAIGTLGGVRRHDPAFAVGRRT